MCLSKYCPKPQWFCSLIFSHYMFFSSCMWPISSCGSRSSDTRSKQRCTRSFRLEEQSADSERGFCCWWGTSMSICSPFLQQFASLHPSPQQPESACSTFISSMLSETELTLGGGFSKAILRPSMTAFSCWETRCRRSVTDTGTGLSGCWIWYQHHIALWRETQRGNSVRHNGTEKWQGQESAGQKRVFNKDQNKRGSWCFWERKRRKCYVFKRKRIQMERQDQKKEKSFK